MVRVDLGERPGEGWNQATPCCVPVSVNRVIAVALIMFGAVVLVPSPVHACSCAVVTPEQATRRSEVAVMGVVRSRDLSAVDGSSLNPAVYGIEVQKVFRGNPGARLEVYSAASGASCGLEVRKGRRYLLFAAPGGLFAEQGDDARNDARLWAHLCNGTQRATPRVIAQVEQVTGPGMAPRRERRDAVAVSREQGTTLRNRSTFAGDDLSGSAASSPDYLAGGLFLVAGAAVAGVWALRRRNG
jgi:hypothetical protein